MADFVLIHGTTQSPVGWERLVGALEALGHRSATVDLDGSDERDATWYAECVATQVPADMVSPVVVAHSGSGLVLPAAARRLGAAGQVWLAAYVPDGHRSLIDEVSAAPATVFNPDWLGKDPTSDPDLATRFLFHDCDPDTLRWALTTLRPFIPQRLYREPVPLSPDIPSTYILATTDRTLRPDWCRRAASDRLGTKPVEIDAGHCPHVSAPEETAAILHRAVRR